MADTAAADSGERRCASAPRANARHRVSGLTRSCDGRRSKSRGRRNEVKRRESADSDVGAADAAARGAKVPPLNLPATLPLAGATVAKPEAPQAAAAAGPASAGSGRGPFVVVASVVQLFR
jgi:hypothetical protein